MPFDGLKKEHGSPRLDDRSPREIGFRVGEALKFIGAIDKDFAILLLASQNPCEIHVEDFHASSRRNAGFRRDFQLGVYVELLESGLCVCVPGIHRREFRIIPLLWWGIGRLVALILPVT